MPERFADIEAFSLGSQSLEARLKAYPELRAKIETMLNIIENAGGDVEKAAVAEQRVIDALRARQRHPAQLGPPAAPEEGSRLQREVWGESEGKKHSTGTRGSAKSP